MSDYVRKNKITVFFVVLLFFFIAVGTSTFAQKLAYKVKLATTSGQKDWEIIFTGATQKSSKGSAKELSRPSYNATLGNIDVSLSSPGDEITYDFEIANLGKLDAELESVDIVPANNPNDFTLFQTSGLNKGDILKAGQRTHILVRCYFNPNYHGSIINKEKMANIVINYVQAHR